MALDSAPSVQEPGLPVRLVLLVAVFSVGVSAILIRLVGDAPALTIAFYRLFITFLLLAPIALTRHRSALRGIARRDLIVALVVGVVLAVHFATWFESLFHTSVASSVVIVSTEAIFAALLAAVLFGERLRPRDWGFIALAFAGVVVIAVVDAGADTLTDAPRPLYGNLLAFIGALAAAVYLVAGRRLRQRVHLIVYVSIVYGACSATLFLFVLLAGAPLGGFRPETWLLFLLMAIFPTIGGHTLFNWSLRYLPAATVSTAILGEPLVAILLAAVLLAEIPGPVAVTGAAMTLVGILGIVRRHRVEPRASGAVAGPS